MKLSHGESDYTDLTTMFWLIQTESENENNNDEIDIYLNLDACLDEDNTTSTSVGSILAVTATGSNAQKPEASSLLPSVTGCNADEPEVNPELMLLLQPSGTGFN